MARESESQAETEPSPYLYFVGAPEQSTKEDLHSLFEASPRTASMKGMLLCLNNQGRTFGRGILEYENSEMAQKALTGFKTHPVSMFHKNVHFTFSKVTGEAVEKRNAKIEQRMVKVKKKERKARISFMPRRVKR